MRCFVFSTIADLFVHRNLDHEAFAVVDRPKMLQFLLSLKRPDGSFSLHDRGETDSRGSMPPFFQYLWLYMTFLSQAIVPLQSHTCAD
jgi:prenyltransferase beta subunit